MRLEEFENYIPTARAGASRGVFTTPSPLMTIRGVGLGIPRAKFSPDLLKTGRFRGTENRNESKIDYVNSLYG